MANSSSAASSGSSSSHTLTPALVLVGDGSARLWGNSLADRLRKQFAAQGMTNLIPANSVEAFTGPIIFVRANAVFDDRIIPEIIARENLLLLGDEGTPVAIHADAGAASAPEALAILTGLRAGTSGRFVVCAPGELEAHYSRKLKKREVPYVRLLTDISRNDIEWRMFMGTYKGATDIVTKRLWPVPAFHVVRFLAARGITPNMVTSVSFALVFVAFFCFLYAWYLTGLVAAWGMTFLDTVDGKLARTTMNSSKFGDKFDHLTDLIHPPFWYLAWGLGLPLVGLALSETTFMVVMVAIFAGYIVQRLMEGAANYFFKFTIHIWRPIDTLFREITARRNPNLVILTVFALFRRPDLGIIAVAVWTVVCLVLHAIQLAQAHAASRKAPLESWMTRR